MSQDVRDPEADREAAIRAKIRVVEAEGGDASHLKGLLKSGARRATEGDEVVIANDAPLVNVPQPMAPGTAIPGQPISPLPVGQPEPNDGSAPDKRRQDNSPVLAKGEEGTELAPIVTGPKDPGPGLKESGPLPDQNPGLIGPEERLKAGVQPTQEAPYTEPPAPATEEELQREAAKKDRRAEREEAAKPSPAIDANPAAPIVSEEQLKAEQAEEEAKKAPVKAAAKAAPAKAAPAKRAGSTGASK